MEIEDKVFHSSISRVDYKEENNLYELLKIVPAAPAPQCPQKYRNETWEFTPNNDKHYIPRKGSKLTVKTVSEIRTLFEKDIYSYLPDDLEKQQKYLLRKIRDGSSNEEETKKFASKLMSADKPISRSAWQMLVNINPENHNHRKQFVLWNGKCIQVNGSRGGKTKFICSYDLKKSTNATSQKSNFKKIVGRPRLGLLRNSLNVKFKPSPLGKKKFIDNSYHKYQIGHIELIKLPTPVLEISPTYGIVLEPAISSFIKNLRGETGSITQNLAEFAVSVLGTIKDQVPEQLDKESCITFNLNYKCDQNRLLMSRSFVEDTTGANTEYNCNPNDNSDDKYKATPLALENDPLSNVKSKNDLIVMNDVKKVMDEMLNTLEISINQDTMYSVDDESRGAITDICIDLNTAKDKPKRKYCELDKLDVTVIKLPDSSPKAYTKPCGKSFCTLGCICESLDRVYNLKQHCGALDCMFGCKCEVAKYKELGLLERDCSELIPGLLNYDNAINSHMAKEEQKFHQTVIVSGEKSIFLKSRKRTWKSSKKYPEFYDNMNLKTNQNIKRILTVDVQKLCCKTIEPFCMVHNLYMCFCNGKFTESYLYNVPEIKASQSTNNEQTDLNKIPLQPDSITADKTSDLTITLRPRVRHTYERKTQKSKSTSITESSGVVNLCANSDDDDVFQFHSSLSCARAMGYIGRKYTDGYYKNTNNKILEMEQNDSLLRNKLLKIINGACDESSPSTPITDMINMSSDSLDGDEISYKKRHNSVSTDEISYKSIEKSGDLSYPFANVTGKSSLTTWLESSYKSYKERLGQGIIKHCLDAPKKGKAALQSWDFILSRYSERKNIFFVSKLEPFRTFLAVDDKHPFFATCINIDDIRFADLPKYPLIIRNLVTNATDSENSFCILRGWDHCWELIGSAVKVIERVAEKLPETKETNGTDNLVTQEDSLDAEKDNVLDDPKTLLRTDNLVPQENSLGAAKENDLDGPTALFNHDDSITLANDKECEIVEQESLDTERSKWFVMTVENDFTEIQFYKRGFFVTYDGIQRSICLARISGKTVRLSSQARSDKNSLHQFGLYAIPCIRECCVFIGPYEIEEPLGIEVVKTFLDTKTQNKTRGVWITTNKVDNMKVIEHPLSFMPSASAIANEAMVTLESSSKNTSKQSSTHNETNKQSVELSNSHKNIREGNGNKVVKPIKIRRTNGFYHLSSNNILKKIAPNQSPALFINKSITVKNNSNSIKSPLSLLKSTDDTIFKNDSENVVQTTTLVSLKPVAEITPNVNISLEPSPNTSSAYNIKPVAEIAPQIKITSVYSESSLKAETDKNQGTSMLVLKPEEINKKLLAQTPANDELSTDIEKFLETSTICIAPRDAICIISDGEDEDTVTWKDVWIKCSNVANFGCIRGRRNESRLLSFEFPGFKYSEFYTENEAFDKINQVLARKIYIPKHIQLQWKVMETKKNLKCDFLTQECLKEKRYLLFKLREIRTKKENPMTSRVLKAYMPINAREKRSSSTKLIGEDGTLQMSNEKAANLIENLEETSRALEKQSKLLWNEAVIRRNEIFSSLSVPNDLKIGMSETLQDIMSMNETH